MCIHAGQEPDPVTGARIPPIHQNTGFVFKDTADAAAKFALQAFGPIYTRIGNPTAEFLEKKVAALEGGMYCLSVASGHAAQFLTFTNLMNAGDNFVTTNKLYGGSVTQFSRQFKQFGSLSFPFFSFQIPEFLISFISLRPIASTPVSSAQVRLGGPLRER